MFLPMVILCRFVLDIHSFELALARNQVRGEEENKKGKRASGQNCLILLHTTQPVWLLGIYK